jgi:Lar family restriction alleviation protein
MPDATTLNLLPCPFCGGTELSIRTDLQSSIAYVVCSNCDAQGPPASFAEMLWEKEEAAAGWNQRSTWQPIETAPRDGTWVLLAGGECEYNEESDNRGRVVTAQWTTEYRSNAGDRPIADFGRWEFAYYDSGVYWEYENPTHLQPLPSPPITPIPHA